MTWIFEIKDKSGRKIHLSNERWKHIVTEHSKLANKIENIKDTISSPLIIGKSKYDENVRYYQKYYKKLSKYLLVSVKYLNGEGFVITAFYTAKPEK
mgnify:CR=1 FL=1